MKLTYPIAQLCLALGVSRSGFYAWRQHQPSRRAQEDTRLGSSILQIHARSRQTYGSPRIREELREAGVAIGRRRVARLMRQKGIYGRSRRRRSPQTTDSNHDQPLAPNLLKDRAPASRINEVWVTDITYIPTDEGWLYLAGILDVYSRKIVGWSVSATLASELCLDALSTALQQRRPPKGLIHHSDRGVQYASHEYRHALHAAALVPSMSRRANCYDNALAESFWSTLKTECLHRAHFQTRAEASLAVFDFIECFYNPHRRHSSLGYRSPVAFETINN
jgi:transposase InsO family protein